MNVIAANYPVIMRRDHWNDLPEYSLPAEYSLRRYRAGDVAPWVEILRAAYGDNSISAELFQQRFAGNETELARRQYFLCERSGTAIGTATAWWDDEFFEGENWGRVRAVAIHPRFQEQRLTRPLLAALCRRFPELGHQRAFLDTSTKRLPAIKLYWRFGFRLHLQNENDVEIWRDLEKYLEPPQEEK